MADTPANRLRAAEEVLARMAEETPQLPLVQRVLAAIRSFLRPIFKALGVSLELTDAEIIRDYLTPARDYVRRGAKWQLAAGVPAFSRGGGALDVMSPEFREQIAALEQQHAEVLRAHREDGKPLPAPNGQPSNLTAGQWLTVRTPNFKRWFGDWEAAARVGSVRDAVEAIAGGLAEGTAKGLRQDLIPLGGSPDVVIPWGGSAFGLSKIGQRRGMATVGKVLEAIALGDIERHSATKKTVTLAHGDGRAVLLLDEHGEQKTWLLTGWEEGRPDAAGEVRTQSGATQSAPAFSRDELGASLRLMLTIDENVSKVVDANGEPLVVYHATSEEFASFRTEGNKGQGDEFPLDAAFFAETEGAAREHGGDKRLIRARLSIKNPRIARMVDDREADYSDAGNVWCNPMSEQDEIVAARKGGNDGVIFVNDATGERYFAAFRPEQIKSAIGNSGTFNPADPRIDFNRGPAAPASWQVPDPSRLDDFIHTLQDKNDDLRRIMQVMRQNGAQIADRTCRTAAAAC